MPSSITIQVQGLDRVLNALQTAPIQLAQKLDEALERAARNIETKAKQRAPVDIGGLRNSIGVQSQPLSKEITVNAFYAAFIEFGTGKYAAQYVATLPPDWQSFAAQYRGQSGGGSFMQFLDQMTQWVRRHGLSANVTRTGRRRGNRAAQDAEDRKIAYLIIRSILKNGIKPRPFLYNSYMEELPALEAEITRIISTFAI